MKLSLHPSFLLALCGFLLINASPLFGQAAEPKVKKIPFSGKLESVDTSAQTITINGKTARVFHLTQTTKITDGSGNPSTLSAAVVGEDVGGSYSKDSAGTMTLFSVRFGAKTGAKPSTASSTTKPATPVPVVAPAPAPAAPAPSPAPSAAPAPETAAAPAAATTTAAKVKKEKFSGKVVSVDAAANTLVVHGKADQTFTVTSATKITGADGLASITAGAKVSGSYTKSADGATMTLATLKVAK